MCDIHEKYLCCKKDGAPKTVQMTVTLQLQFKGLISGAAKNECTMFLYTNNE